LAVTGMASTCEEWSAALKLLQQQLDSDAE